MENIINEAMDLRPNKDFNSLLIEVHNTYANVSVISEGKIIFTVTLGVSEELCNLLNLKSVEVVVNDFTGTDDTEKHDVFSGLFN